MFGGAPDLETKAEETPRPRKGIVCFITVAGFLNGEGFQKMRADLRRDAHEIWVINCSPEGHQPPVGTRVFQGVQQPVCIVLAAKLGQPKPDTPARVRFRALPEGPRGDKFAAVAALTLDDEGWADASTDWRASFLPEAADAWASYTPLQALFGYDGSGVMPGRTWVIAPDKASLEMRWNKLVGEKDPERKAMLFYPHLRNDQPGDKHVGKLVKEGLSRHPHRAIEVAKDKAVVVSPERYGFRSFDRQWIIPDARLINQANPSLWSWHSGKQVYGTALKQIAPRSGPAITFTALLPDMDHYKGSFGGRAFPLWADAAATKPNIRADVLAALAEAYGRPVPAQEVFAYVAAVAAHPAYTARFQDDLKQPGLRIPFTADAALFDEAVALGREVLWLHTFGERFAEGRPTGPPKVKDGPTVPEGAELSSDASPMPDAIDYDPATRRLLIGQGFAKAGDPPAWIGGWVENVDPAVWAYEVSGKNVLRQWFGYRRKTRSKPPMGDRRPPSPLSDEQPKTWPAEYTTELIRLLNVLTLVVRLEPRQADLLDRIVSSATLDPTSNDDEDAGSG